MNRPKLVIFDLDDTLCDTSGQRDTARPKVDDIKLFPGVPELLGQIRSLQVTIVIVSTGNPAVQERKVELLGLRKLVDRVLICELPEEKRGMFQWCLREFAVQPAETMIVGDRVDREISIGKELHCLTVRVLQGRHSHIAPSGESQSADLVIQNIFDLQAHFES